MPLLNRTIRGISLFRGLFYLPSLLGGSVALAIVWRSMFNREGAFNSFLALFGILLTIIHLVWPSPLMFTIFMLFGQSSFAAGMVLYGFVILRDLKHRKAL